MPSRQSLSNRNRPRKFPLSKVSRNWPDPLEPHPVSLAEEGQTMQTTPMWNKSVSIVLINALIVLLLASCVHRPEVIERYEDISLLANIQSHLERGDTVRIFTNVNNERRVWEFKITDISSEAIEGEEQKVYFSDITKLEKKNLDVFERVFGSAGEKVKDTVYGLWVLAGVVFLGLSIASFAVLF